MYGGHGERTQYACQSGFDIHTDEQRSCPQRILKVVDKPYFVLNVGFKLAKEAVLLHLITFFEVSPQK